MIRFITYFFVSISLFVFLSYNNGFIVLDWLEYEVQIELLFLIPSLIIVMAVVFKLLLLLGRANNNRNASKQIEAVTQMLLGFAYVKIGDARSASVFVNRANKVLSDQPMMKLLMANNELLKGNKEDAKKYLKDIIRGEGELLVIAINQFLNIVYAEKNFLEVEHTINQIQRKFPKEPWSLIKQAEFYCSIQHYKRALTFFIRCKKCRLQLDYDIQDRISLLHYAIAKESYIARDYNHALFSISKVKPCTGSVLLQARILFGLNKINKAQDLLFSEYHKDTHPDILNLYLELGGDMKKVEVIQDEQGNQCWQCTNCYVKTGEWDFSCSSCDKLGTICWL